MFKIDRNTLRELVIIAIPMVISQGAFAAMAFTDRYFLSMISPTHMAASLGGLVAYFFCLSLFTGVLSYATALVAQYYGANTWGKCSRVVTQGMIMSLACLPLLALAGYFVSDLFIVMGHDVAQAELEQGYFQVLMWGSVFALPKICLASYFSGLGQTRKVMIADILSVFVNVPLSYVLIFGEMGLPELGILGAGIGTIISNLLALLVLIAFYLAPMHRQQFQVAQSIHYDKEITQRYLKLGFPSGMEMFLNIAAFNLFLLMFQSYGITEGASIAIVFNWDILSFVTMMGLNIALVSLTGRFMGSGNMANVNEIISSGFILGLGYSALLAVIYIVYRGPLVELFISDGIDQQPVRELSLFMMVGLACFTMGDALILVCGGILRGAGDTRWLMKTSVTLHWIMLLAQVFVIKVLGYGPKISWLIFVSMILSIAAIYLVRLSSQHWRDPKVLAKVMQEG